MNCQYIKENELHEKYLLDRLKETDKNEYLKHLKKCDSCHVEFERQRFFISSVRETGKREMKSEIALQVQELKSRKKVFDWDMVLKVAAVFLILVITPALVYYHQTFEPLKTGEFLDAEELSVPLSLEKEKPKKIVQSEIVEKKSTETESEKSTQPAPELAARIKTTVDKNLVDLSAGSGSRSAEELSKNEIGAKKESMSFAEESIPKSPPPANKDIPNLGKFSKPVIPEPDEKSFNDIQSLAGKSVNKKMGNIQTESYAEDQIQAASPKKQKYLLDGISIQHQEKNLLFETNGKTIQVSMEISSLDLEKDSESIFPKLFPVNITKRDSLNLEMKWYVNTKLLNINEEDISMRISEENKVYISLFEKYFYEINLVPDTTMAILLKR